jgi:hypothetical protein
VTLCDTSVTPKVFQFIGPSNDGRRHGRGTFLFMSKCSRSFACDCRNATSTKWRPSRNPGTMSLQVIAVWLRKLARQCTAAQFLLYERNCSSSQPASTAGCAEKGIPRKRIHLSRNGNFTGNLCRYLVPETTYFLQTTYSAGRGGSTVSRGSCNGGNRPLITGRSSTAPA